MSHLTRGAWIEILSTTLCDGRKLESRTSHEVRGLKYLNSRHGHILSASHLTRGAWIEIACSALIMCLVACRTSHEVRGLKYAESRSIVYRFVVAPHTRCVD